MPSSPSGDAAAVPLVTSAMDSFHLRAGTAHCEEVPLPVIAQAVGTPVYVYSAAAMRSNARGLQSALAGLDDPLIAYAIKANPNAAVLATLAAEGLGADIVSGRSEERRVGKECRCRWWAR